MKKNLQGNALERRITKRKAVERRRRRILAALMCMILCCGILFAGILADARNNDADSDTMYQYYKSITIRQGDTLWNLAKKYKAADSTVQSYVDTIKELNGLCGDGLKEGQNLMIVYYDNEFK